MAVNIQAHYYFMMVDCPFQWFHVSAHVLSKLENYHLGTSRLKHITFSQILKNDGNTTEFDLGFEHMKI